MRYVVVDIETTGGRPSGKNITEIGIAVLENGGIVKTWHSMVKPQGHIPHNIQLLTGITDDDVQEAPTFAALADDLRKELLGDVFVAHSVNYDYTFIEEAFIETGHPWRMPKLCTVRYSKAVFPSIGRYNLSAVSNYLALENKNPHRALSDAICAAEVLMKCLEEDSDQTILKDPKKGLLQSLQLPNNITDMAVITNLPTSPGIYQFLDAAEKPLYIGKANNIQSRIKQHLSTGKATAKFLGIMEECHSIVHQLLPNETLALVLEDHLIKNHWPKLNRAQKHKPKSFGLYTYTTSGGQYKWAIQKNTGADSILRFSTYASGFEWTIAFLNEHEERGMGMEEAFELLKTHKRKHWLLKLKEGGALYLEGFHVRGLYQHNDYILNKEWVENNFLPIHNSSVADSLAEKHIANHPEQLVLLPNS